jgi:5-methylcytosine-specific restriction protein A
MKKDDVRKFAFKAWPILVESAENKKTIFYSDLAERIGFPANLPTYKTNEFLEEIQIFCKNNSLPPLSGIVVNKNTGKPGMGFSEGRENPDNDRIRVESFEWRKISNPFDEEQKDWSDSELGAAVDSYLKMLEFESRGEAYSKAEENKRLRNGLLASRSKASIEYRMQNISAALQELSRSILKGYLPAKNIGSGVKERIQLILAQKGIFNPKDLIPTSDEKELSRKVSNLIKGDLSGEPMGNEKPKRNEGKSISFDRDPQVRAWVLKKAKGICEGCKKQVTFETHDDFPYLYLEVHHVYPLGDGGSDRISNAVALCPNCHRRCHLSKDRKEFTQSLYASISRLKEEKL